MADIGSLPTPGQKPWNLNPALLALNAELEGRLSEDSVESAYGGRVNVQAYGARGDGVTDDHAAIQAALDYAASFPMGAFVFLPPGVYLVSDELRVGDYTTVEGAGQFATRIKTAAGVDKNKCVITNAGNTRVAHSTPNHGIRIAHLTVDGNADGVTREDVTVSAPWGSAITLACVEDSVLEDVYAVRGNLHCIDISASVYLNPAPNLEYAPGPSRNIKVLNCIAEDSRGDDGITVHYSEYITIEGCVSRRTNAPRVHNQIGIEIDEGSRYITVRDTLSVGWNVGFQAKGHGGGSTTPPTFSGSTPAHSIDFINCVADGCNYGFELDWQANSFTVDQDVIARNIRVIDCTSRRNTRAWSASSQREALYSLYIARYQNVTVRNFLVADTVGGGVLITERARDISVDVTFRNACTAIPASASQQYVAIASTAKDVEVTRAVNASADTGYTMVSSNAPGTTVKEVKARYSNPALYPVVLGTYGLVTREVGPVLTPGAATPVRITSGDQGGNYGSLFQREPTDLDGGWKTLPLLANWGGAVLYMRQGNVVHLRIDGLTPPAGSTSATRDFAENMPQGYRPASVVGRFALEYSTTPPGGSDMWMNGSGRLRVTCQAGNVFHGYVSYMVKTGA